MRELSLFTGIGGGLLGSHLLGWTPIGYVELDKYCQKAIAQRIIDGILPEAPIFSDVRAFISEGYAKTYQGMVDVITAGFPCQPFSVAGKQAGENDPRNMWKETLECIRLVRPKFALLENVPALLTNDYMRTIFGDIAKAGFNARWKIISAGELGAPHKRDRLWIICTNSNSIRCGSRSSLQPGRDLLPEVGESEEKDEERNRREYRPGKTCKVVSDTYGPRCERLRLSKRSQEKFTCSSKPSWWEVEPPVGRVVDGLANRVDRLKALGNGQIPAVVRAAWELLAKL